MKVCKVVGNVWATKKNEGLEGCKLMIVCADGESSAERFVAADFAGAGIGETVLVVTGSTARQVGKSAPIDAAIVGIVDSQEIAGEYR